MTPGAVVPADQRWKVRLARARGVVGWLGPLPAGPLGVVLVVDLVTGVGLPSWVFALLAVVMPFVLLYFALAFVPGLAVRVRPAPTAPPVTGRWVVLNSPASRVPSHGGHQLGQSYAVDLVHEPEPGSRPVFGRGPQWRRNEDYPAFGRPVLAPADGVVVSARDGTRDHRARSGWLSLAYLLVEGGVREVAGTRFMLGNHVVLRLDSGAGDVVLAHLQRGSVGVGAGDRVVTGQEVARCGNSGNSSEPHVHVQLMDHPWLPGAAGLPFRWEGTVLEGTELEGTELENEEGRDGIPVNQRAFTYAPDGT